MIDALKKDIDEIVSQLISNYKPEKIILFGSVARGDMGPDSDLDFFVIKRDVPYRGIDRFSDLMQKIRYSTASDFLICTPDEVEKRLSLGDPFIRMVMEEGKVLYGA